MDDDFEMVLDANLGNKPPEIVNDNIKEIVEDYFACNICGTFFDQKRKFHRHLLDHEKPPPPIRQSFEHFYFCCFGKFCAISSIFTKFQIL